MSVRTWCVLKPVVMIISETFPVAQAPYDYCGQPYKFFFNVEVSKIFSTLFFSYFLVFITPLYTTAKVTCIVFGYCTQYF